MCPACWDLRAQKVEPQTESKTRLQNLGLGFGIASVLPFWPLLLVSLVLNVVAIVKAKEPPARDHRWKPVVGLCLTLFFILAWVGVIAFAVNH